MTRLPILLLLISLVYATHTSKKIGDDATLSCSRNNTSDYVVMSAWYKEPNSIILLAAKSDVLYFDKYTKDKISYDSPYDDLVTTITIKSLTSEDAGTYVCAFFMTNDTTDKVEYEEYSTELIVNTDSESTIDIILSGSTPETISEKPDYIDNSNCSSAFEIATPEPITDNEEDHTVTYTSENINTVSTSSGESTTDETTEPITDNEEDHAVSYTTVSTSSGIVTTKSTTDDADLYDTYNDNESSSTVSPTTVENITKSIGKYSTKDYVEVFGIAALIILSAVAVFCITYYICNKRSRKYKTENKV
nr:hemagglutinin [Cowpox virus]